MKATPVDKVHTWPHLLLAEFVAALFITAFLLIFSIFVNAPLLGLANTNLTPNPSKAPWYFLGLQELLTMFHPMVAGPALHSTPDCSLPAKQSNTMRFRDMARFANGRRTLATMRHTNS